MIKFIPLNQNILQAALTEIVGENCLLLFPTRKSKKEAQKLYQQKWDLSFQHFHTMDDWKESLFVTDKPILKEEKRTLALFQSLTSEYKDFFKINSYHQFIEFAHNFFHFWQELIEEQVNLDEIEEVLSSKQTAGNWQLESFYKLSEIKQNYKQYLHKIELEDTLFIRTQENFVNIENNKIIVVNQFYFTNFEKELLKQYESKTVILTQAPAESFDAATLSIKEITAEQIKPFIQNKPKILQSTDQTEMIAQLGNELQKRERSTIIDFQFEKQSYSHLLSGRYFSKPNSIDFSQTRIFRFFKILLDTLSSIIWKGKPFLISVKSILNLVSSDEILEYFIRDIENRELFRKEIFGLIDNDYKYIDPEFFTTRKSNHIQVIEKYYELLIEFRKINSLHQFINFIQNKIDVEYLLADYLNSSNLAEVFYESLADFVSIEDIGFINDWKQIFPQKLPKNLLKLFLDYLKPKKIKLEAENVQPKFKITTLHDTRNLRFTNLSILNVVEGILPDRKHIQFLLSENQREELGLKTYEDITRRDKFYFFRLLCNSDNTAIFTRTNLEENIEVSSFIEELKIQELVAEVEPVIYSNLQNDLFSKLLENNKDTVRDTTNISERFCTFSFEYDDFPQQQIDLSFYKWEKMQNNPFEFYLEFVCKIQKHIVEIEEDFSPKLIGTIAHEIITIVWKRLIDVYKSHKFKHNFILNTKQYVKQATEHYLKYNQDFIYISPHNFSNQYFQKVFIPILMDGIENFFYRLHNDLNFSDEFIEVFPETGRSEKKKFTQVDELDIFLKGRPDLRIHTQNSKYIFDFKTGAVDSQKIKRYNKQLQFYENICYLIDIPQIIEKLNSYLFFVEQKDIKKLSRRIDLKEEIENSIKQTVENGFGLAEKADKFEDIDITRRDLWKK